MRTTAPLDRIDPSPHHHRTNYGDMEALAASIKSVGIIHALVVRQSGMPMRTRTQKTRSKSSPAVQVRPLRSSQSDNTKAEIRSSISMCA